MANNYFISYDLMAPGQHYDQVHDVIKNSGNWAKIEYSLFYLKSKIPLRQLTDNIWARMTSNDKLIVIDCTNNDFYAYNVGPGELAHMQRNWIAPLGNPAVL